MAHAVESAIDLGSNYYTLTYIPSDTAWHEEYRTIHVRLLGSHSSDKLSYRHGHYADDPDLSRVSGALPSANLLQAAQLHGAPAATQIIFRARVAPMTNLPDAAMPEDHRGHLPIHGQSRRYVVQYQADERNVTRTVMPDGTTAFKVSFIAIVYDSAGKIVNSTVNPTQARLTREQVAGLKVRGIQFLQQISVPETGDYSLRILVHDELGDHVGAVELPIRAVKNLPAVTIPKS